MVAWNLQLVAHGFRNARKVELDGGVHAFRGGLFADQLGRQWHGRGKRLLRRAVGHDVDAALQRPLASPGSVLVFSTHNKVAGLRGNQVSKVIEDLEIGFLAVEEVEVIGLDGGEDRNVGAIAQQGGIGFIGLGNESFPGATVGIGTRAIELAADGKGRIETRMLHRAHGHRRGGGFAMGAGQQHLLVAFHQGGEQIGAANYRDIVILCGY